MGFVRSLVRRIGALVCFRLHRDKFICGEIIIVLLGFVIERIVGNRAVFIAVKYDLMMVGRYRVASTGVPPGIIDLSLCLKFGDIESEVDVVLEAGYFIGGPDLFKNWG